VFETGAIVYQREGNTSTHIFLSDGKASGTNLTGREFVNVFPAWSPDGALIAFASVRNNALADIYVMNADGSELRQLTDDAASDTQPAWSPDGARLVFVSDRAGDNDLYLMNADGTEPTPLSSVVGISEIDPAWSPDGSQIVFTYSECPESGEPCHDELYVLSAADGSGLQQLTQGGVLGSAQPVWSPDGQLIVFASDVHAETPDSPRQLVLMNADGSDTRPLVVAHLSDMSEPAWSPDGTQILFLASSDLSGEPTPGLYVAPLRCFDAPDVCLLADLFRIPITGPAANPQWRPGQ
jgi:TolB protein